MVGLTFLLCTRSTPNRHSHSTVVIPYSESSRTIKSGDSRGIHQQLWEEFSVSSSTKWWDCNRVKIFCRHKIVGSFAELKKQDKPTWVDSKQRTQFETGTRSTLLGLGYCSTQEYQLQSFCQEGKLDKALDVLLVTNKRGVIPSVNMYSSLLKACSKKKALGHAKQVHAHLVKNGLDGTMFLGEFMVSTLVKCGGLQDALQVFRRLPRRSVFSWSAIIAGCTLAGQGREALRMYECMLEEGVDPDTYTFVSLLRACGSLSNLGEGKRIHSEAVKHGCGTNVFVGTCLVDMYGKCGSILEAQKVFDGLSQRDVVTWTSMLAVYAQQGQAEDALQLYEQMREEGVSPDIRIFVCVLQACGMVTKEEEEHCGVGKSAEVEALQKGKILHADAGRKGYDLDSFVGSALVSLYAKCGSLGDAQIVFDGLSHRDVVAWTAMLTACARTGQAEEALDLYFEMWEDGVSLNDRTFVSMLQACGMLAEKEEQTFVDGWPTRIVSLDKGKEIHAMAWKKGHGSDTFVGNTLVSMYSKCGSIVDAQTVFDDLLEPDVVSWTAILVAYALLGQAEKALQMYQQMRAEGLTPNGRTFVGLLQACSMLAYNEEVVVLDGQCTKLKSLEIGKAIHSDAERTGYALDLAVRNTLVSMYGKCGSIVDAQNLFDRLPTRSVVSWTAMVAAYAQQGHGEKALQLYRQMQEDGVSPNEITVTSMLQACSNAGGLDLCRQVHRTVDSSSNTVLSPLLATTLIHAYGRCASMMEAQTVFDGLGQPDVVSWTALITGYARQGNHTASLSCYEKMRLMGVKPNGVTLLSLLCACNHAGLVDDGVRYFKSMNRDYGISPGMEHYASLADILGRAGHLSEVANLLSAMPVRPNLSMWMCLLAACRKHGKVALGKLAFDRAVQLDPVHAPAYVLMWNIYSDAGLWDNANMVNELRQQAGAWRKAGQSWIEHGQEVHSFVIGEFTHPQQRQLHSLLGRVGLHLPKEGSLVEIGSGPSEIRVLAKIESLCLHADNNTANVGVTFDVVNNTPHECLSTWSEDASRYQMADKANEKIGEEVCCS